MPEYRSALWAATCIDERSAAGVYVCSSSHSLTKRSIKTFERRKSIEIRPRVIRNVLKIDYSSHDARRFQ